MNKTDQVRRWWAFYRCTPGPKFTLFGKEVRGQVGTHDAWTLLADRLAAYGYDAEIISSHRFCPRGIGGKPCQDTGKGCSLHNYSLAMDFDPFDAGNPHFYRPLRASDWDKIKFTRAQVSAGESIQTKEGLQVFRWLGWALGDTMHWEINISPTQLAAGFRGYEKRPVPRPKEEKNVEEVYARMQASLVRAGYDLGSYEPFLPADDPDHVPGADGKWGSASRAAQDAANRSAPFNLETETVAVVSKIEVI